MGVSTSGQGRAQQRQAWAAACCSALCALPRSAAALPALAPCAQLLSALPSLQLLRLSVPHEPRNGAHLALAVLHSSGWHGRLLGRGVHRARTAGATAVLHSHDTPPAQQSRLTDLHPRCALALVAEARGVQVLGLQCGSQLGPARMAAGQVGCAGAEQEGAAAGRLFMPPWVHTHQGLLRSAVQSATVPTTPACPNAAHLRRSSLSLCVARAFW